MNRSLGFLVGLILATVIGCDQHEKLKYANVKGSVTFGGKPLEKGQVTFAVSGLPPTSMEVVDGKFAGTAMVGENIVAVSAKRKSAAAEKKLPPGAKAQMEGYREYMRGKTASGDAPEMDLTAVEMIPPEWSTKSKQMRVVESGRTNEFDIDIKGKN